MCGIVGVSVSRGAIPDISGLVACLAHRGPDDKGMAQIVSAGAALGQTRLSIIDLSDAGHQPMFSPDGRFAIVFNGEIYNFKSLRDELLAQGEIFVGGSDTEVLLKLCMKYGVDALPMLNGIFAIGFLDVCAAELLLVRDGLGVKPLYYAEDDSGIWFSSELKALALNCQKECVFSGLLDNIDQVAIARYLTFLWCPGDATPIRQVRKLSPGGAMRVRAGRIINQWLWYHLPVMSPAPRMSARQAIRLVRDRLEQAVHRQLVADVPVGGFLSGGLDSSAVAYFASANGRPYQCFTILQKGGVDAGETDDLPYAREVAEHLKVSLNVVEVEADRAAKDFRELVWWMDEPLADPASYNVFYICQRARQSGVKVLLSGAGGDDLFFGYRRHTAEWYARFFDRVPHWLRAFARRLLEAGVDHRSARLRKLAKLARLLEKPTAERLVECFVWTGRGDLHALLSPRLRCLVNWKEVTAPLENHLAGLPSNQTSLDRLLNLEQRFFLADHNLVYTDRLSMATGVEVRVPFLDRDLVETAAAIPLRFKQHRTVGKWVLREAMRPLLPASILSRAKAGFGAPLRRWINGELARTLDDLLSRDAIERRGLFDAKCVADLRLRNRRGEVDGAYTLFSLAVIEQWCRYYLDGEASEFRQTASMLS